MFCDDDRVVDEKQRDGEENEYDAEDTSGYISKKHPHPGGMTESDWMRSIRAVRDTPVADHSAPGANTTRCVIHRPSIAVLPFLPTLSVSYCKQNLWRCGQL